MTSTESKILLPVRRLGRSIRWAVTSRAIAHALAGVVCIMLLVAWIDTRWQTHTVTGRWLNSLSIAIGLAAGVIWIVTRYRLAQYDPLCVASLLEEWVPAIRGWLVNSLSFLRDSHTAPGEDGSDRLKRATMLETAARLDTVAIPRLVNWRPVWRAWQRALICWLLLLVCFIVFPTQSRVAVRRLAAPWRNVPLVRDHHLTWIDLPERVTAGSALTVRVADRSQRELEEVALWYRLTVGGSTVTRRVPMQRSGTCWMYRWDAVDADLQLRATGGDDSSMPWTRVTVVEPPHVTSVQVRLRPPAYSGWPASAESEDFTVLTGTQAKVTLVVDRPLADAGLRIDQGHQIRQLALVPTDRARRSFSTHGTPWIVREAGDYWFALQDIDGVWSKTRHHRIVVQPDLVPRVDWRQPLPSDWMSPRTILWLDGMAEDDFGLQTLSWELRVDTMSEGANSPTTQHALPIVGGSRRAGWSVRRPLSACGSFSPGQTIGVRIQATDAAEQTVTTAWREWQLYSENDVAAELNRQWNRLVQRARDSRDRQQDNLHATASWSETRPTGQVSWAAIAAAQSRLHDNLLWQPDSLLAKTEALCGALDRSGLHVSHLLHAAEQLRQQLQQPLTATVVQLDRLLEQGKPPDDLPQFRQLQSDLLTALQDAVAQSDHWQQLAMLLRDVAFIVQTQRQALSAARERQSEHWASERPPWHDHRPPRDTRDPLLVCRQIAVWRHEAGDWLQQAMEHDAVTVMGRDRVRAGLLYLRQRATESTAYDAAEHLLARQWNLAAAAEEQVLQHLESLLRLLQGPPSGARDASQQTSATSAANGAPTPTESESSPPQTGDSAATQPAGTPQDAPNVKRIPETTGPSATTQATLGGEQVWGALPRRVRQALQQATSDDILPGYERTVADYYRRLRELPPK